MYFISKLFLGLFVAVIVSHLTVLLQYPEENSLFLLKDYFLAVSSGYVELTDVSKIGFGVSLFFIIIFLLIKEPSASRLGFAKYARKKDIKTAKLNSTNGLFVGKAMYPPLGDTLTPTSFNSLNVDLACNEPLSWGVFAPPGTGKTTAIVIPTLLKSKNSFIINDPKGEIFEKTASTRLNFSKVLRFDPMQKYGKGITFNPFSKNLIPEDIRKVFNYINQIANVLIQDSEKGGDAYFTGNARVIFIFVASYFVLKNGKTSLPEISSKIFEEKDVSSIFEAMIEDVEEYSAELEDDLFITEDEEEIKQIKARIKLAGNVKKQGVASLSSAGAEQAWASIISTLTPILQVYATDELIKEATEGENEVDILTFKETSKSLYMIVPDEAKKVLYPLIRLLVEISASKVQSAKFEDPKKVILTYLIDEFPRLGQMKELLELPAVSRGQGVTLCLIAQSLKQIEIIYTKDHAENLFSLLSYWYIFKQGDSTTAKKISDMIGKSREKKKSVSYDTKGHFAKSSSYSISDDYMPLVTPEEILSLDRDFGLVLATENASRPILVKHNFYYKNKKLLKIMEENKELKKLL